MPRAARIVYPGVPHHIAQRGNRRQRVFFSDEDKALYLRLLSGWAEKAGLIIWAYCLMDDHVHHVAVPETEASLAIAIGETHKAYTRVIDERRLERLSLARTVQLIPYGRPLSLSGYALR